MEDWPSGAPRVFPVGYCTMWTVLSTWVSRSSSKALSMSKCFSQSNRRRRDLLFTKLSWAARLRHLNASWGKIQAKQQNMMRQFRNICQLFSIVFFKWQTLISRVANYCWPFRISQILKPFTILATACCLHGNINVAVFKRHKITVNVCISYIFHNFTCLRKCF